MLHSIGVKSNQLRLHQVMGNELLKIRNSYFFRGSSCR